MAECNKLRKIWNPTAGRVITGRALARAVCHGEADCQGSGTLVVESHRTLSSGRENNSMVNQHDRGGREKPTKARFIDLESGRRVLQLHNEHRYHERTLQRDYGAWHTRGMVLGRDQFLIAAHQHSPSLTSPSSVSASKYLPWPPCEYSARSLRHVV